MEFSLLTILGVFGAGLLSVSSPCVLPVLPILVTGRENDHKHRPLLIVAGLSITFILMGVITSLFSTAIMSKMLMVEKVAGVIVLLFGILMAFDVNIFKKVTLFNKLPKVQGGLFSGFFLGLTLGLIWIPCIGPMLSGVLGLVASKGTLVTGIVLLLIYSLGFAIPMLLAGYATQFFRSKMSVFNSNPQVVRWVSASILVGFGLYILIKGLV